MPALDRNCLTKDVEGTENCCVLCSLHGLPKFKFQRMKNPLSSVNILLNTYCP